MSRWVLSLALLLAACDDGGPGTEAEDGALTVDAAADAAPDAVPDGAADAAPDAAPDPEPDAAPAGCAVSHRYDPLGGDELELFPDDLLTRDDPQSPTGLRLDVTPETAPWVAGVPDLLRDTLDDMGYLSGFGLNAGVVLRFTGPVTPDAEGAVQLLDLGPSPPVPVPAEVTAWEDGATLVVQPLRPLRPRTRHALVVTTALQAADGGCVAPAPVLGALLAGDPAEPRLARIAPLYADLLAETGLSADALVAATIFTTHGDHPVMADVAARVRAEAYGWAAPPACEVQGNRRVCEGAFEAWDFRADRFIAAAEPVARWTLPVTVWLPAEAPGPYPTLVFAHGINASRDSGAELARHFVPRGFAVIATDAVVHGEHPSAAGLEGLSALAFLGIDTRRARVDAMALRGNFEQTTADRLQLLQLVRQAPDVDGDGAPDLDGTRMAYFGISLGGMLGSALLALDDGLDAGVLSVAGGRLLSFVTDTAQVAPLRPLLTRLAGSEAHLQRLLPVLQTLVDAADPATFAPHVLHDRFPAAGPAPHLLFPVAAEDETVPPASGRALARALAVPHVGPVATPVELLVQAPLPVSGNLGGEVTAGYFQLDRVSAGGGVAPASHGNAPFSPEGLLQSGWFLETWLDREAPEIVDPYAELMTPPLP